MQGSRRAIGFLSTAAAARLSWVSGTSSANYPRSSYGSSTLGGLTTLPGKSHTRRRSMSSLRGARVLVVEDEAMLSLNLEAMLLDLGCVVAGTADELNDALQIARTKEVIIRLN